MPSRRFFFFGLLALESLAVTLYWWHAHFTLPDAAWLRITFRLIVFALVCFPCLVWWEKRRLPIILSLPTLLILMVGCSLALFLAQAFLFPALWPHLTSFVPTVSLASASLASLSKLTLALIVVAGTSLAWYSVGLALIRSVDRLQPITTLPHSLRHFTIGALGLLVWIVILLVLNSLHALTPRHLWLVWGLLILWAWQPLTLALTQLARVRWTLTWTNWLTTLSWVALFFLVVLNLGDLLRPEPLGYDDMTAYFNQVRLMSERHALIPADRPQVFEILATAIQIMSGAQTHWPALSLGLSGLFLGTGILSLFSRTLWGESTARVTALLSLSLPMGGALAIVETKPDSLVLPLAALVWWYLWRWYQAQQPLDLWLSALGLGLAVTVKLTALLLVPAWSLTMLLGFFMAQRNWKKHLVTLAVTWLLALLPILPWWFVSAHNALTQIFDSGTTSPTLHATLQHIQSSLGCQSTGSDEDYGRYAADRPDRARLFYLPWDTALNETIGVFATEVGYLWLLTLPWLILYCLSPTLTRTGASTLLAWLLLMTLVSWSAWYGLAHGVLWYGYPLILPLLLVTAWTITHPPKTHPSLTWLLIGLFIMGLIGQTAVRMKFSALSANLEYASGQVTGDAYIDKAFPGYAQAMALLNRDREAKVYVTGSRYWYGIHDNDTRAYMDARFDTLTCLLNYYGPRDTVSVLQQLGVRYLLFSRDFLRQLASPETPPTLVRKIQTFIDFVPEYLRPVWGSGSHMIFEFAPELSHEPLDAPATPLTVPHPEQ